MEISSQLQRRRRLSSPAIVFAVTALLLCNLAESTFNFDYRDALAKSILFLECQRSGKLPEDQRVTWRGDSALLDGSDANVDLSGGYYDAGDNVKFGFPMAFTVTVLAWGALESQTLLQEAGEAGHVAAALKWGADFLVKASADVPNRLWVQVGDADADHHCWERPENMDTPRTPYQVNASTEVAAEMAAALAAASMALRPFDPPYADMLSSRAITLFQFADTKRSSFTEECPFYCSFSGYNDELLWSAGWLYKATKDQFYLDYIRNSLAKADNAAEFNWDNKFAGFAVLMSKVYFEGDNSLQILKQRADFFMCCNLPDNPLTVVSRTPGGLIYLRPGANTQYAGGAAFLAMIYSSYLLEYNNNFACGNKPYSPWDLFQFAQTQVDYILGKNPLGMSYMVGFGDSYPQQAHHRGASILGSSLPFDEKYQCVDGFRLWFSRGEPNPNLVVGAIVGGPDINDQFTDLRSNSVQLEPTTYTNTLFAGAIANLLSQIHNFSNISPPPPY